MGITSEINVAFETNHGNIVIQVSWIEFLVDENVSGVKFNMSVEFRIIVNVPFSKTNSIERIAIVITKPLGI